MTANDYRLHIMVLPEDDANRQIANGFSLEIDPLLSRRFRVLPVAGGWKAVLDRFGADHLKPMEKYSGRHLALLIDRDGEVARIHEAQACIPKHLIDRVFVLGALSEPEALKKAGLGSYEEIGRKLARDCREQTDATWNHVLLQHNASEVDRLRKIIRPVLFPAT